MTKNATKTWVNVTVTISVLPSYDGDWKNVMLTEILHFLITMCLYNFTNVI